MIAQQMENHVNRCKRCILPQNYPGVSFKEDGVCELCHVYKEENYLGWQALKNTIRSFLENKDNINKDYDCVLGLSGGRDSVYLLYYLVRVMRLRVLAYSADNGFVPEETKRSLKRTTETLDVDLLVESHDYQKKCLKHHVLSWMKRPSAALITMICTGCRLGIYKGIYKAAIANKIPIVIVGGTPFEGAAYKTNLIKVNPYSRSVGSLLTGYLHQVAKNPRWVMRPSCLTIQIEEFYYHLKRRRILKKQGILYLAPFYKYLYWKEKDVIETITTKLGWNSCAHAGSTWKRDCAVAPLKSYMYRSILGFDDKDDHFSWLVRDGQISREEALNRIRIERNIPKEAIENIIMKLGIDYSDFEKALKRAVRV